MKLEQYFEAYEKTHTIAGNSPVWSTTRRRIQWSLARPFLELAGRVVFILGCVTLGIWGHPIGYLIALGTLCFIPQFIGNLREQTANVRNLSSNQDLQRLLYKEAKKRMAGAVLGLFYFTAMALLFLGTSAVLAWLGKDFFPSLVVGVAIAALAAHCLIFRLPSASREKTMLDRSSDGKESSDGN